MTGLLAALASALLAALVQAQPPPAPTCFPAGAQIGEFESHWFCRLLAAAGKGRLGVHGLPARLLSSVQTGEDH